jgi:hypothetical protein
MRRTDDNEILRLLEEGKSLRNVNLKSVRPRWILNQNLIKLREALPNATTQN